MLQGYSHDQTNISIDYNQYINKKRKEVRLNSNFVIAFALLLSGVFCTFLLFWNVFVVGAYAFESKPWQASIAVVGEYADSTQAASAASQDKLQGGAGFVYSSDSGSFVVLSLLSAEQQANSLTFQLSPQRFFGADSQEGQAFLDYFQYPLSFVDFFSIAVSDYVSNYASIALIKHYLSTFEAQFLQKSMQLYSLNKVNNSFGYAKLAVIYQKVVERLSQINLTQNITSTLNYFLIDTAIDLVEQYNTL